EIHERRGGLQREIILLSGPQAVRGAHRLLGAEHRVIHFLRIAHLDRDRRGAAAAEEHLVARERDQGERVETLSQYFAFWRDDADHLEVLAAEAHVLPDGADALEELLGDLVPEHDHRAALRDVRLRQRAAGLESIVLYLLIRGRHAEHADVAHLAIAPHDVRQRSGKAGGEGDRLRVRNRETNRRGIGDADARPAFDAL